MNDRELLEHQFMNEMVTPKIRKMEADNNDNDIDKYIKTLESRMWKAVGIVGIIMFVGLLIAGICYK